MKILFLIAESNFRDEEYFLVKDKLVEAKFQVITASSRLGLAKSKFGKEAKIDVNIYETNQKDYDAIVIAGGPGSRSYFDDEKIHLILNDFNTNNKLIAAICSAPVILAKAKLLKNKKATVFFGDKDLLIEQGVQYLDTEVIQDKNIITGNGPKAAVKFALKIITFLNGNN